MPKGVVPIFLSDDDKSYLKSILQKGTMEARVHRRARILLLKSEGMSDEVIADKLDITRPTVKLCLKKYRESGVKTALEDSKGRGRRIEISNDAKAWVVNIACQKPSAFGLPAEVWYPESLTRYINSVAEKEGHSRMATASEFSIRKILRQALLNPHKVIYYCERRNPDFKKKKYDVRVIYKQMELCFNENGSLTPIGSSEANAVDREEMLAGLSSYENERPGALFLLIAIDLLTEEVVPLISHTCTGSAFVTFLKILDEKYPKGSRIRLILDNRPNRTSQETQEYLNTVPGRFIFVFTPPEWIFSECDGIFFGKMTYQMLFAQAFLKLQVLRAVNPENQRK